jgi:hypothetical protein
VALVGTSKTREEKAPEDGPVDLTQTWGGVIPFINPKAGVNVGSVLLRHLVDFSSVTYWYVMLGYLSGNTTIKKYAVSF